ncbi:MAG TPA: pyridoxamine 5'-phosphate oxidase family protein [Gemmatimonadaceae bacterium]|jgi:general stress protein 26
MSDSHVDDLYDLIDGIEVAMLTTRRSDGQLVSRAMQTQRRTAGADLWFVTNIESNTFEELAFDPHVNVSYYRDRTREWVSVSGRAILSRDRDLIRGLHKPDWKIWFREARPGDKNAGTVDDPRIALILVEAQAVAYFKRDRPLPLVLFDLARAMVGGAPPDIGDQREVTADELRAAARRHQSENELRT